MTEKKKFGKLIGFLVLAGSAAVLVQMIFFPEVHGHSWWHRFYGFEFLFGIAACLGIVLVSKALGKVWLQRDENYYGEEEW